MSDIARLIALNPFQAPTVTDEYVRGQRLAGQTRRANELAMRQQEEHQMRQMEADRKLALQAEQNRLLSMGAGPMELARAGFIPAAESIAGIQGDISQSQRRKSQSEIEREELGLEWAKLQQRQQERAMQPPAGKKVQQAKIMPGGLVQIVNTDGTVEIKQPEEVDAKMIQDAEMRGAELQGLRAGERKAASIAQDTSREAFEKAFKVRQNVATFQSVIDEIKAGAGTGPLKTRLPSLRAASVRLDNIQRQLGLDLINSTTFGALSESELKFALEAALPTQLEGPELVRWTEEKMSALTKLAGELEDLAIYTGQKGANLSTFLLNQRQERKKAKAKEKSQQELPENAPLEDLLKLYK